MNDIPVVNFEKCSILNEETNKTDLKSIGNEICEAFVNCGFVYLVNTGITR